MQFKITNINYTATIVELKELVPIIGKTNIQGTLIFGNHVIISKDYKIGDIGIYFPVECKINSEFLKINNLFKDPYLNSNPKLKGFFEPNCRVKTLKLGGVKSEGFWIPIKSIANFFNPENFKPKDEFNLIDDKEICTKYIVKINNPSLPFDLWRPVKQKKKLKLFNQIIETQFNFHIDTPLLNKNIHKLNPNDIISITNKLHGTSAIFCNILINRKLSIFERILKSLGIKIESSKFGNIYSSRVVIKNKYLNDKQTSYNKDIWTTVNDEIKSKIPKGFTIYGEIVGYLPNNSMIQKGYHYNCEPNTHKFYVYRISNTNSDGLIIELSWPQLKEFCNTYNLTTVPEFYYGFAKDCFPDIPINDNWNIEFLKKLSKSFNMNDNMCKLNNNEVPAEGIVLRIDKLFKFEAFKLKNFKFQLGETKANDAGIVDIESQENEL